MNLLSALPGAVAQGLVWGIVAIGVYTTYKILDFADMTVDGSICTGAAVCTVLILGGMNPILAMIFACLAGFLAGALTGTFHIVLGIPGILSGILTQLILWSVNLKIMGKANLALSVRSEGIKVVITQMRIVQSIEILVCICAVLVALLYLFFGTELGCSIRATGCNANMSRAQGINTDFTKILGLSISNGIVAFGGALLCQYQGSADINMGRGAIVIGLAAVIIGEAVFSRISSNFAFRFVGVVVGSVIYYLVYQLVISVGFDSDLLKMFSAIVVVVFLGTPYVKKKYLTVRRRGEKKNA